MPRFFKAFRTDFGQLVRLFFPALLLATPGCAGFRSCHEGDPWLGTDKFKHFAISGAIAAGVTAGLHEKDSDVAVAAGMGAAMVAGTAKEWHDLYNRNTCWSWKDLVWDFIGASVGASAASAIRD